MLATGIKSPVGVKVAGTDTGKVIDRVTGEIEKVLKDGTGRQQRAGRAPDRRALRRRDDQPRRSRALRCMNIADVQSVIASAVGGDNDRRDGRRPAAFSDQPALPARDPGLARKAAQAAANVTERARGLCWSDVADIRITDGPPMLRSENASAVGLRVLRRHPRARPEVRCGARHAATSSAKRGSAAAGLLDFLVGAVRVPGARELAKLKVVVPFTLLIIFVLICT